MTRSLMDILVRISSELDFRAAAISVAAGFVLGGLWFSPLLFGKWWLQFQGITREDFRFFRFPFVRNFFVTLISLVFLSVGTAVIIHLGDLRDMPSFLLLGAFLWLAFSFPSAIRGLLWMDHPLRLILINSVHDLLLYTMTGILYGYLSHG